MASVTEEGRSEMGEMERKATSNHDEDGKKTRKISIKYSTICAHRAPRMPSHMRNVFVNWPENCQIIVGLDFYFQFFRKLACVSQCLSRLHTHTHMHIVQCRCIYGGCVRPCFLFIKFYKIYCEHHSCYQHCFFSIVLFYLLCNSGIIHIVNLPKHQSDYFAFNNFSYTLTTSRNAFMETSAYLTENRIFMFAHMNERHSALLLLLLIHASMEKYRGNL